MNVSAWEQLCLWELSGRAQRAEKTCAHDTSQPHYTMEERERACTPAALTMIPLPCSLTPSPSSGSHQDSDDLMMRETTLIIHTQQTSPPAVLLSHTDTHSNIYRHARITTDALTHPCTFWNTQTKTNTEILAPHTRTVCKCRNNDKIKKNNIRMHMHKQMQTKTEAMAHTNAIYKYTHASPHTQYSPGSKQYL